MMRPYSASTSVRPAAVAGLFYPDDAGELRGSVRALLDTAASVSRPQQAPKAMIVPHAGYVYSGPTAAAAYALLRSQRDLIRRVVLVGPSHRVAFRGIAAPQAAAFSTPLGTIQIDRSSINALVGRDKAILADEPYRLEHCLEVQLPFLQCVLDDFSIVPLVAAHASAQQVSAVLGSLWGDPQTLLLASSDLSHYQRYEVARQHDAQTCAAIMQFDTGLAPEQACGAVALNGLLHISRERGLKIAELARANSGDACGDRTRVVGYGAFALYEPDTCPT